ncbi:MAG: glutaredoxin family protein [bacterium]|nr:glutaredoxin family protein [bacterium]
MPNVTIYTTPSCVYCKIAKEFFRENNIKYTELNVVEDDEAREEMVEKSGQMGVPVIMVGDQVIIGFDEDKVSEALSIS